MDVLKVEDSTIAESIKSAYNHKPQSSEKITCLGPTYIVFRHGGRQIFAGWRYETELFEVFSKTFNEAVPKFQRQWSKESPHSAKRCGGGIATNEETRPKGDDTK